MYLASFAGRWSIYFVSISFPAKRRRSGARRSTLLPPPLVLPFERNSACSYPSYRRKSPIWHPLLKSFFWWKCRFSVRRFLNKESPSKMNRLSPTTVPDFRPLGIRQRRKSTQKPKIGSKTCSRCLLVFALKSPFLFFGVPYSEGFLSGRRTDFILSKRPRRLDRWEVGDGYFRSAAIRPKHRK